MNSIAATIGVIATVFGCVHFVAHASLQDPGQRPAFRGGTDVVAIAVSVLQRNAPVRALTATNFEVRDNDVIQRVDVESVENLPIDLSLVFDRGFAAQGPAGRFAADLGEISRLLRSSDRLRVISFARDVEEVVPMTSTEEWTRLAPDLHRRLGPWDEPSLDLLHDPARRASALFDALILAMSRPLETGRRHLVIASSACLDVGGVVANGELVARVAVSSDAVLYVSCTTVPARTAGPGVVYTRTGLAAAATWTGGGLRNVADGVKAFKQIFADFRQSYLLSYTLTGVPAAGWHTITVTVPGHANYSVRARTGYAGR